MRITILTLFPEMFDGFLSNSIIKRAIAAQIVEVNIVNIRDYTTDKNHRVDSAPVGGGAGLIMKCQPILDCLKAVRKEDSHVILLSPRGKTLNQQISRSYASSYNDLIIICGHYEGIDERVNDYVDECISIGDFILTGGEIASMAIADSVIRLLDGAIADESTIEESFENGLLEYPQYTEPRVYDNKEIPTILYSGNHQAINKWRKKQALDITRRHRPDLFNKYVPNKEEKKLLNELDENITEPEWQKLAIEKGKKFTK